MPSEFRRKPSRKNIIRNDRSYKSSDETVSYRERKSTTIKRTFDAQRTKATLRGRVIEARSSSWIVTDSSDLWGNTNTIETRVGGLAISNNDDKTLVCIGDIVLCSVEDGEHGKGTILEVEKRESKLLRKVAGQRIERQVIAANIEQVLIVASAAEPFYNTRLIDRYLIAAEDGGLSPVIIINKCELMDEEFMREDLRMYNDLGIPVHFTSCKKNRGLDDVRIVLEQHSSVLAGPSGVGKSSLINALFGISLQEEGEISDKYQKGKHTTTTSKVFALGGGAGAVIDTPGMREFGIIDIPREQIAFFFHDFDDYYPHCKYSGCTHTHEPDCAVKAAVEDADIDPRRYDSYLRIIESITE
ncbi:MAG: ribosome small subunit-dependent GTPase A [Candidatus Kapabacteria bacterium]|nr:ribosome small subunit-dependent GTPase A [Candidatus Kapabacteria bacterium]